jgi:hypothetical protein
LWINGVEQHHIERACGHQTPERAILFLGHAYLAPRNLAVAGLGANRLQVTSGTDKSVTKTEHHLEIPYLACECRYTAAQICQGECPDLENQERPELRRYPRFELDVDVTVNSQTAGLVPGRTVEMSEQGVSVLLPVQLPVGEIVELRIKLPWGPFKVRAAVRNRNVFRHGLELLQSKAERDAMRKPRAF